MHHLTLAKRKRFFDDYLQYRADTAAYQREETSPMFLAAMRLASEGVNTLRVSHPLLRTEVPKKEEIAAQLVAQGFEHLEHCGTLCFWRFGNLCSTGPDFYMEYSPRTKTFDLLGTPADLGQGKEILSRLFPDTHVLIDLAFRVDQYGVNTTPRMISNEEEARASFYPFLSQPLEDYFRDYMASKASVLLLIGPPGTGKTSFLRSLVRTLKLKSLLAYNKEVLESPFLYQSVRTEGYDLLALEDADNFVMSRKDDNPFMATLLNDTQGVANASNMKIVISTNLSSLNKVDSALVRPGRCFGVLHFRELDQHEANVVWKEMKMPKRSFGPDRFWPLSQVLNPDQVSEDDSSRKSNPVGFMAPTPRSVPTPSDIPEPLAARA